MGPPGEISMCVRTSARTDISPLVCTISNHASGATRVTRPASGGQRARPMPPGENPGPRRRRTWFRGAWTLECLDERLGHVRTGDSVLRSQGVSFLTHFDCAPTARAVEQEACADDRIVNAARAELFLDPPPPAQRVSLDEVQERAGE